MSQESNHLAIWGHASKTDPSATKNNTQGNHKQTSIDGYWMIQKATELWGPIGTGWGYEILEDRFDEGAPIYRQSGDAEVVDAKTTTHTIKLRFWYMDGDKERSLVQYGHTPFIYKSKWGATTDHEAPKKSLTDAIKKSLSMLGFCADVFMGQFDDVNYVNALRTEFDIEKADEADDELQKKRDEFNEWCQTELATYPKIPNGAALKAVLNGHFKKIQRQAPVLGLNTQAYLDRFQTAYNEAVKVILKESSDV